MSTVDKAIADSIIAGEFTEAYVVSIVRYENAWGNYGYGVTFKNDDPYKYLIPTEFILSPVLYWTKEHGLVQGLTGEQDV